MRKMFEPGVCIPDTGAPSDSPGGSFRRVLVPIDCESSSGVMALAVAVARTAGGPLRVVHVRMWDAPVGPGPRRFYTQSSEEATLVLDNALSYAWACDADASGVVVDAERSRIASAILKEASTWAADVIVVAKHPRKIIRDAWDKASDEIICKAFCPVLLADRRRT